MAEIFHITERVAWLDAARTGEYRMSTRGITLEDEGFIHCSLRQQLPAVAKLVYGDAADDDLVVLAIDSSRVSAPIRYEAAEPGGDQYPHIYGALPVSAVTHALDVNRDDAGDIALPG